MKPGPKPKPTEMKRKAGNPGNRTLPDLDGVVHLEPVTDTPAPLRPLSSEGTKAWQRVWDRAGGWLSMSDIESVQLYAEALDDYVVARTEFHTMRRDSDAPDPWRLRKQVGEAADRVMKYAHMIGLSPSARAELGVAEVRIAEGVASLTGVSPDAEVRDFGRVIDVESE